MNITRSFIAAVLLVAVGALPAMAVHFTDISLVADCDGYVVTYAGKTFPWESVDVTFNISLTDLNGNVTEVVEMINVPVDNSGDPSVFGGVYQGTWDAALSGTYTISGVAFVELYDNPEPGNAITWDEAVLDGGIIECVCEVQKPCNCRPNFRKAAKRWTYRFSCSTPRNYWRDGNQFNSRYFYKRMQHKVGRFVAKVCKRR